MFTNNSNSKEFKLELKNSSGAVIDLQLTNPTDEQVNSLIVDVIIPVMNPSYLKGKINKIIHEPEEIKNKESVIEFVNEEKDSTNDSGTSNKLTTQIDFPILVSKEDTKEDEVTMYLAKDRAKSGFSVAELFSAGEEEAQQEEISAMKKIFEVPATEEKDRENDFYRTGIKLNANNKKKYRLGYICPKCGNSGRHYIPSFVKSVSCHECQTLLEVEPATKNGFGEGDQYRDSHGNYFVAMTLNLLEEGM